jgi:hypothetical protein
VEEPAEPTVFLTERQRQLRAATLGALLGLVLALVGRRRQPSK